MAAHTHTPDSSKFPGLEGKGADNLPINLFFFPYVSPLPDAEVFISFHDDARRQAQCLQDSLSRCGVRAFMHDDVREMRLTKTHIKTCKFAVVLGTKTYGQQIPQCFSTYEEMQLIIKYNKLFVWAKMCDVFLEALTSHYLSDAVQHCNGLHGEAPPSDLLRVILAKLRHELLGHTPYLPGLTDLCQGLELDGELYKYNTGATCIAHVLRFFLLNSFVFTAATRATPAKDFRRLGA